MLLPGLHAQLFTGTWLGVLKTLNRGAYVSNVALRLKGLLEKQAQLRAPPGQRAQPLPPKILDALTEQLNADTALADALGSTTALSIWHRLCRVRLDEPKLLESLPPQSQGRWLVEAINARFLGDLESLVRDDALQAARTKASASLKALREAVDAAAFDARSELWDLTRVEEATAAAAAAAQELQKERQQASSAAIEEVERRRTLWKATLGQLRSTHASVPAVTAELSRLSSSVDGSSSR